MSDWVAPNKFTVLWLWLLLFREISICLEALRKIEDVITLFLWQDLLTRLRIKAALWDSQWNPHLDLLSIVPSGFTDELSATSTKQVAQLSFVCLRDIHLISKFPPHRLRLLLRNIVDRRLSWLVIRVEAGLELKPMLVSIGLVHEGLCSTLERCQILALVFKLLTLVRISVRSAVADSGLPKMIVEFSKFG